jgi:hypothetical protein
VTANDMATPNAAAMRISRRLSLARVTDFMLFLLEGETSLDAPASVCARSQ